LKNKKAFKKLVSLKDYLKNLDSAIIAFSGGLDSSFLLKIAQEVLKKRVVAVTAKAFFIPPWEIQEAQKIARSMGVKHLIISTQHFKKNFLKNTSLRCYWCKRELFKKLRQISKTYKIDVIMDGTILDDKKDFRPGFKANREYKIISPLKKIGFLKEEIRLLAKHMGLSFWNKPSTTCLGSRIPFGERITFTRIKRIEKAEYLLRKFLGENILFRLRDHNTLARLEIEKDTLSKFISDKNVDYLLKKLKHLGYRYITIDLEGYKPAIL